MKVLNMSQHSSKTIQSLSRLMKRLVLVLAAGISFAVIYVLWLLSFDQPAFADLVKANMFEEIPMTVSRTAVTALILLGTVNLWIAFSGLSAVWHLFDGFERGDVFSARSGGLLRKAGVAALIGAASIVLSRTLAVLIVTLGNPPGQKVLLVVFGTSEVFLLLVSVLLLVMGHIIRLAADIDAENRSFV